VPLTQRRGVCRVSSLSNPWQSTAIISSNHTTITIIRYHHCHYCPPPIHPPRDIPIGPLRIRHSCCMAEGEAAAAVEGGSQPSPPEQQQPLLEAAEDGPPRRGLTMELPPAAKEKAVGMDGANGNGTAVVASTAASARTRGQSRLLADSLPAKAAVQTRPRCYLEKASLWSLLTFGCVAYDCIPNPRVVFLCCNSIDRKMGESQHVCVC
jgi:hypothetical protein